MSESEDEYRLIIPLPVEEYDVEAITIHTDRGEHHFSNRDTDAEEEYRGSWSDRMMIFTSYEHRSKAPTGHTTNPPQQSVSE